MSLGQPPPPSTESQQISPNRAKNGVCVLNKVKNGPKRPYNGSIRAEIYKQGVLGPKKTVFTQLLEHLEYLENPDSFETIQKIGNHLEKSGSLWKYWGSLKGFFLLYAQNFPSSNATLLPRFLRLCWELAGLGASKSCPWKNLASEHSILVRIFFY